MSKIAIFVSVFTLGFVLDHWLRNLYPGSVHGIVRGVAFWAVLALVYLVKDSDATQTIPTEFALALLYTVSGFMLGDTIALVTTHFYALIYTGNIIATGQNAPPQDESTPPQHSGKNSTKSNPQLEDDFNDATSKDYDLANGSNKANHQQSAEDETEAMHNMLAEIIKGGKSNKHNGYQARAFPNRRLEVAFRVNNCFTAMERQRCDKVRNDVLGLLQPAKPGDVKHWRDWPELVEVARKVTKAELSDSQATVNLFAAMQMIVMKTMLKVLFDQSPADTTKDSRIRKLAKDVNLQWQDSKTGLVLGEVPEWDFEQQGTMKATAEETLGPWDDANRENPFNKILPGYETMWRVVLRCLLELSSSRHPSADTEAWKERLASFIANPTKEQLQKGKNDAGLTADHVSFEILPLYPPTRHVAREQKVPSPVLWGP